MNTAEVIKNLIKLGTIASDIAEKHKTDNNFNYSEYFTNNALDETSKAITNLLKSLNESELSDAVEVISKKQHDLLANRQIHKLDTNELVQYATLTDAKLLLKTAILKRSLDSNFFEWLVEDGGLAGIIKIANILLPLVV